MAYGFCGILFHGFPIADIKRGNGKVIFSEGLALAESSNPLAGGFCNTPRLSTGGYINCGAA
jgi:hypothetical protein